MDSKVSKLSKHPLRPSLFPNRSPYLRILPVAVGDPSAIYDPPLSQHLRNITFVAPNGISPIVEECIQSSGKINKKNHFFVFIWSTALNILHVF